MNYRSRKKTVDSASPGLRNLIIYQFPFYSLSKNLRTEKANPIVLALTSEPPHDIVIFGFGVT